MDIIKSLIVKDSKKPYSNNAISGLSKNHLNAHCINKANYGKVAIDNGKFKYENGHDLCQISATALKLIRDYRIGLECSDGVFFAYDSRSPLEVNSIDVTPELAVLKTFLKMDLINFRIYSAKEVQRIYISRIKEVNYG